MVCYQVSENIFIKEVAGQQKNNAVYLLQKTYGSQKSS